MFALGLIASVDQVTDGMRGLVKGMDKGLASMDNSEDLGFRGTV
jgi:hypothetical protein